MSKDYNMPLFSSLFANLIYLVENISKVNKFVFLSLDNYGIGEYIGLTGKKIDGAEMLACGLATHFVLSKVCIGE